MTFDLLTSGSMHAERLLLITQAFQSTDTQAKSQTPLITLPTHRQPAWVTNRFDGRTNFGRVESWICAALTARSSSSCRCASDIISCAVARQCNSHASMTFSRLLATGTPSQSLALPSTYRSSVRCYCDSGRENLCNNSEKRKSHVFLDLQKHTKRMHTLKGSMWLNKVSDGTNKQQHMIAFGNDSGHAGGAGKVETKLLNSTFNVLTTRRSYELIVWRIKTKLLLTTFWHVQRFFTFLNGPFRKSCFWTDLSKM